MSAPAIDFNPFAPEIIEDPYPALAQLRQHAPVYEVENLGLRILSRYDDVQFALRHPELFSSTIIDTLFSGDYAPVPDAQAGNMMAMDPPNHTRLRRLVSRAFTAKAVAQMRSEIEGFVSDVLGRVEDGQEWDFVEQIGKPLPINVFFHLLGVEPHMYQQAREWADDLMAASRYTVGRQAPTPEEDVRLRAAMKDYGAYLDYLVELRRKEPGDDLVSGLVQAAEEGEKLTHNEVLAMIYLLIGAGTESTQKLISNMLLAFLNDPAQYAELRSDPALIPGAVEETLRYDGPAIFMARVTTQEVVLSDTVIPAGSVCLMCFASANHDDAKFPDPTRFDIHRDNAGLVAFGHGLHRCLGAPLATLEATVVLEQLVANFASFEWDPKQVVRDDSFFIRGLNHLPIKAVRG